jgi:AraC-like DNA-binding protein
MHLWSVERDRKTGYLVHTVKSGHTHSLLAPIAGYGFRALGVSASIWEHENDWFPIHVERNVTAFELEHGLDLERGAYNRRMFDRILVDPRSIWGEHAGFWDLFVPIVMKGWVVAVLVVGPIAKQRPTPARVVERWQQLTGRHAHTADPEFSRYLGATLSVLVLEGKQVRAFERLTSCFALLASGRGQADEVANEWERVRTDLERLRFVENTWDAVREMVDERTSHGWASVLRMYALRQLGLSTMPEGVLVGLAVSPQRDRDSVEQAILRDAFQRRAVHLAHASGDAVAGRVGGHGVVFLLAGGGPSRKRLVRLRDLAHDAAAVAKRDFAFDLFCGAAQTDDATKLDRTYQAALGAAESALVRGDRRLSSGVPAAPDAGSIRRLRRDLERSVEQQPTALATRFDRYIEVVAAHCGYGLDGVRLHLEVGFERVAERLADNGVLDERGFANIREALARSSSVARTTEELISSYREAVSDLAEALENPVAARHDRSLRRALDHIRQHFTEPLSVPRVAKIAAVSPAYFSKLFRRREGTTFERYVVGLRLERAKHLLVTTDHTVVRVARLSGFRSSAHFCRAFRRAVGRTPLGHRERARPG